MEEQFQTVKATQPGVSIKELFFKYVRFLPLFVMSVALALLAGYLYLRYTTPIFKSSGAILIKKENGSGAGNDPFQQMFVLDNSISIQNEIELLKSLPVMERVVEDLNLNFTYLAKGNISETNNYKDCAFTVEVIQLMDSSSAFDLKIKFINDGSFHVNDEQKSVFFGQAFQNKNGIFRLVRNTSGTLVEEYRVLWQPTRSVARSLAADIMVGLKGATGILLVSLEATHPQLAADVVNRLMDEYQVVTREDKNETNRRMLEFIDGRLQGIQSELDSVTRELLNYQVRNNLINSERLSSSYFTKMEKADEQIDAQQVQDNIAQMIDSYLRDRKNAYDLVPSTLGLSDPTLTTLIAAYNTVQLERKALIDANIPVTNLKVQQAEDRIERLRINILESLRNLRQLIAASINRLEQTGSTVQSKIRSLPEKEQEMLEIKDQQANKQRVYNLLMEKREQTAITLAGTISNMKVVEPASVNRTPVRPDRGMVQIIAIMAGLALPALFVFALELLNDKVNTKYDIEKLTSTPIVGEVGHSFSKETLVVKPNNRGIVAEQFRIIRSNLQYFLTHNQKPVILVTSSFSGEGKSFISTNLGAVMSLANKKTIILEFDIRKPKVLAHLNIPKKPGITNYILGKATAEELPIRVEGYDNLYVLACGPVPPNPAELLLDPKIADLFTWLKQNFDVVIIDTAPIGMVSDAMALSQFADSTLYIVRQGHTYKKQIGLVEEYHTNGKLPKVAVLLNDVKVQSGYGYYGAGHYNYAYGSGYFDDDDMPPPTLLSRWFGWLDVKRWQKKKKKGVA